MLHLHDLDVALVEPLGSSYLPPFRQQSSGGGSAFVISVRPQRQRKQGEKKIGPINPAELAQYPQTPLIPNRLLDRRAPLL